ncbi:TonB-dependent receptor [Tenacibaculum sp. AHE15PA]|uniref:TonB-dependent receptor n=1 Tax=unclassified Tenacibaculum TaxID=2635139 RepID=UPI001C4FA93B|nr:MULTISPECIES: TonB-dependent receptor [unclassified Tenacibaculum]QXP73260.1 TonB-dependent receptor [Tenacibaculum sp. AHE14PA]QXP77173.1 TonB-dependent receptor [Tenacibaculum sp. AHE15PA]
MMKKLLLVAFVLFGTMTIVAQTTITGKVNDASLGEGLPGANIKVLRKSVGTSTDFDGKFTMTVTDTPPFTIEVSSLGYQSKNVEITKNNQVVEVSLTENATSLDEVVVSASRTPERIMESPVTVERMDARAIRNTSSPSFYDGLENLKGVDINSNSLTFKSVNTRGFATFANERFMQLVDGMDNSSPALNFALGNLLGMSELDVKTVELLPGASSALYGANAFNGIMFMTSKSPFNDQGISYVIKSGMTSQKAAGDNTFYDTSIRMAHVFSDKFAAKATLSYLKGEEWHATDYRDETDLTSLDHTTNPNYNGLNVYGDEVSQNMQSVGNKLVDAGVLPAALLPFLPANQSVSRTGYNDVDLMTNEAKSVKFGGSLHYRPWGNDRLEIIWNSKYGTGNTIYQGQNRYNIQNFFMEQHKLEFKGKSFMVRGYMTKEDAGDSYDTRFAGININRAWKGDSQWFGEYVGAYAQAMAGLIPGVPAGSTNVAHSVARSQADMGRYEPGSSAFNSTFEKVKQDPSLATGSKFQDQTKLYHVDANLNLQDYISWAEVQLGGSYRQYILNSGGTIFTDYDGTIDYDEFGLYTQVQKKFLEDDRLKVTASARYDKAQNFDGNVSPRLSLSYAVGEDKNHNFRASVQTGFRNPTTQDQYIGLDAGNGILLGTAPDNIDRYTSNPFDLGINPGLTGYINGTTGSMIGSTGTLTGRMAYENSWTEASIGAFQATGNPADLKKSDVEFVKPEHVTAFEVGYRGVVNEIAIDLNVYYNKYKDFIAAENVVAPLYGNVNLSDQVDLTPLGGAAGTPISLVALQNGDFKGVSLDSNSKEDVSSYGATIGLNTKVLNGFNLGLNYTYSKIDISESSDFEAGFNTPEHKVKFQFGKTDLIENLGFNVNVRWQDEFLWESAFYDGMVDARTVVDAQISYRVPSIKSAFKVGAANIGGKEYFSAPGVGATGSQYFVSWTINN